MEVMVVIRDIGGIRITDINSSRVIKGKKRTLMTHSIKPLFSIGVLYGTKGVGVNRVKGLI